MDKIVDILLFAFSILFSIIGTLIIILLNSIKTELKDIKKELSVQRDAINEHNTRLSILETEHKLNH